MVRFQTNFKKVFFASLYFSFSWLGIAHSSSVASMPDIKHDFANEVISVWQAHTNADHLNKIQSATGPAGSFTVTDLTNTSIVEGLAPRLAVSYLPTATTRAVATWLAIDQATGNKIIQAAVLGASVWSAPVTLSLNDGTERPRDDYRVSISQDGTTIGVNWTAILTTTSNTVIRYSYSTNSGVNWTTTTMSN